MINQTHLYYDNMALAKEDKNRLLDYALPGKLIDVGCGDGQLLAEAVSQGFEAVGCDASPTSLKRVPAGLKTLAIYADELPQYFEKNSVDTIIASSVLHEVFSYGNRNGNHQRSFYALESTLQGFHAVLKPGGRLIIRDSVIQPDRFLAATVALDDEAMELVWDYLQWNPYQQLNFHHLGSNLFAGTREALTAFLFTCTWGRGSLEREALERNALTTLEGYEKLLSKQNFLCETSFSYLQSGYLETLDTRMKLMSASGQELTLADSNAIWVAQKLPS